MAVLFTLASLYAQAQTFNVLHNFTGQGDGQEPFSGVSIDTAGNLYGTTYYYDFGRGPGLVYKLTQNNTGWILTPLFQFTAQTQQGGQPVARPILAPDRTLYSTTLNGGSQTCEIYGCGTLYHVMPPATICHTALCNWKESIAYEFVNAPNQGVSPGYGDLLFDLAGDIYGTTASAGNGAGSVYKLTRSSGGWTESTLYVFAAGSDGSEPESGVIADHAGNFYGTTQYGGGGPCLDGNGCGTVYELSPSGSGWTEKVLYSFQNGVDGAYPVGGLALDHSGNLYGTAMQGGANSGGTVFTLSPSGGNWTFSVLYSFTASGTQACLYDIGPTGNLVMDNAGNLYGNTCTNGAFGYGAIFKLTNSNGNWTYTSLHDFTNGNDGGWPFGSVTLDSNGNLFGTTIGGGTDQQGTVWKIMP
jgi:uncharacterized repeat protein (TIGR03803 family)